MAVLARILMIDDDHEWLDFVAVALGEDYELIRSATADDVVPMAKELKPSLIMLDVMMPEHKDGFAAFAELQRDPDCKAIPVIICSEVNVISNLEFDVDGLEEYLGSRPAAFLEKPVPMERLRHEVENAIRMAAEIQSKKD
jgi:response regulator RpfG family c-di-GMP phosphodiesterase